jgi:hypothetical protein
MVRSRPPRLRQILALLHALAVVAVVTALTPPARPAHAATLVVSTIDDAGSGSLRDYIEDFSPNETIDFAPGLAGQTIYLTRELLIQSAVTIKNTSGGPVTIDGVSSHRVFHIGRGATVSMQGLVIQNGRDAEGAGILVDAGTTLTLDGVRIVNNAAVGPNGQDSATSSVMTTGGGLGRGGGISNAGTLTILNSAIRTNAARGGRGGMGVVSGGQPQQSGAGGGAGLGGGLFNAGTATITASSFDANLAQGGDGGAGYAGGGGGGGLGAAIFQEADALSLLNVTLAENVSTGGAGGADAGGTSGGFSDPGPGAFGFGGNGGLHAGDGGFGGGGGGGTAVFLGLGRSGAGGLGGGGGGADDDTNGAGAAGGGAGAGHYGGGGGGGVGAGLFVSGGDTTLTSVSVGANIANASQGGHSARGAKDGDGGAGVGAGVHIFGGSTRLRSTLVWRNVATVWPDVGGVITSLGYNAVEDAAGTTGLLGSDLKNLDLQIAQAVQTSSLAIFLVPFPGSPIVDAIPQADCTDTSGGPLHVDQEGNPRPIDARGLGVGRCDIGAYELSSAVVRATPTPLTFTENDPPRAIDPGVTLDDNLRHVLLSTAIVSVSGFTPGEDRIQFPGAPGITSYFDPATGTLTLTGVTSIDDYAPALRAVTFQNVSHAPSTTPRTATFQVFYGTLSSNLATRQIDVVAVPDPPAAVDDAYTVSATETLTVPAAAGLLKNDTDVDSPASALTASVVAGPAHGSVDLHPDGGFVYTPAAAFAGTDSFTYQTSDGSTKSNVATATMTVTSTACVLRPRVRTAPSTGGGKLNVHVETTQLNTGQNNALQRVVFGALQNARVTLNGQPIAGGQTYTAPPATFAVDFTVERVTPGQPTTVPFTVVDSCGAWQTLVGGGASAGF